MTVSHDNTALGARLPRARADKVNILLVDDQPARLLSYETILGELGQNLICARSGVEALARLMKDEFALVLLDVSMPGMDGFETAAMIHDHPRFERTPIIFITGVHDSEFDRLKGYKLGAVDYVSIPVVPEILRSKVLVLVELHCQRLELQKLNRSLADANQQLEQANTTLQAEKNRELEALNQHLQKANTELAASNDALQAEIAERARAEAALLEADRHKDEFLAILAHELRNPLAPIRNAVEIMSRFPIDNPKLKWSRDVIDRQAMHLTRLVDDLLDISRITRGTIRLAQEPVRSETIIARAVEALQPMISEHRHELSIDCPDGSLMVRGDLTRLVQILGNLLNNAAKYTNDGGRIHLSVRRDAGFVEFRVKDNGIGIAPGSQAKLFNLFSRLETTDDRTPGGLGIGLALVRKLVEMHSGEVAVRSAGIGLGSEFVVRIPLLDNMPASTVLAARSSAAQARHRILVADDNPDALESLALLLECDGHEVWKAANGAEAFALAEKCQPHLALLDIGMPVLDGYEAARRIRSETWGKGMMLVALSGWGQSSDVQRSRESGFDSHLVKPASFDALAQLLSRVPATTGGK
ncbi:MAG TPA: response regulator [Steroidobacteraceae bacterium]|jgi:signal transduction histidine kinase|nr:response regulator [Steroidobacteraceae bacterium]